MYQEKDERKKYLEQWERVKRWQQRIKKIEQGDYLGSDDDHLDEVYAFFMNCYHLKDWLKKSIPDIKQEVENLFDKKRGKEEFKVCADLVNASKHAKANKITRRIDSNTRIKEQDVKNMPPNLGMNLTQLGPTILIKNNNGNTSTLLSPRKEENTIYNKNNNEKTISRYSWRIKCGDKLYDVVTLADRCMELWENFLKERKFI